MGGRCGFTLLGVAAGYGDLDLVKWLLEVQGANIHLGDGQGTSPLVMAAENGKTQVMHYLISKGANIHFSDTTSSGIPALTTPLHGAVRYGQVKAAAVLLSYGATISKDCGCETPIKQAYRLLEMIAHRNARDPRDNINMYRYSIEQYPDVSKIPSTDNLIMILQVMGENYRHHSFVKETSATNHSDGNGEKSTENNSNSVSLMTQVEEKASADFIHLIKGINKVFNQLYTQILPYHLKINILEFLYGALDDHAASRTEKLLLEPSVTSYVGTSSQAPGRASLTGLYGSINQQGNAIVEETTKTASRKCIIM